MLKHVVYVDAGATEARKAEAVSGDAGPVAEPRRKWRGRTMGLILVVLAVNWINPPDFLWRHSTLYIFGNDIPLYGLIGLAAFFWRELTPGPVGCERRTESDGAITGGNRTGNRTGIAGLRG